MQLLFRWYFKVLFKFKRYLAEILTSDDSDEAVARGFALGTFIAILPTPGINIPICLLLMFLFKKINKLGVFLSLAIWNAFTMIPLYWLSYELGQWIFSDAPITFFDIDWLNRFMTYGRHFLFGNVIMAGFIATLSYFTIVMMVRRFRKVRFSKRMRRRAEVAIGVN